MGGWGGWGGWLETDDRAISVQLNLTGTATGTELGKIGLDRPVLTKQIKNFLPLYHTIQIPSKVPFFNPNCNMFHSRSLIEKLECSGILKILTPRRPVNLLLQNLAANNTINCAPGSE